MKQSISGYTRLAGVVAQPIKHSLSPKIHNLGYELIDYDAVYLAFEVPADDFKQTMTSVKTLDMLGVNISMPYKRLAYEACDELSQEAELIGVVNTIVQEKGKLFGYNTDGIGFVESLKSQGVSILDQKLMILGAGGAARAVICQSALDGAAEIHVFKRKNQTFEQIAKDLNDIQEKTGTLIYLHDYQDQHMMNKVIELADIIVNGTQIGMGKDGALPISDMSNISDRHVLVDLIYHPLQTPFLQNGQGKGAQTINGIGMLIHQAAYAFKLMTGQEMPVEEVEKKIIEDIQNKGEK